MRRRQLRSCHRTAIVGAGLGLVVLLGCAGSTPAPGTAPGPVPGAEMPRRDSPRPATAPVHTRFEYALGQVSYSVISEATISEADSGAASGTRIVRERARVSFTITPASGYVAVSGQIEATDLDPPSPTPVLTPIAFADTLWNTGAGSIVEPRMPICGRDQISPAHLATLLPPVPAELHEGLRWERRNIYSICQGLIPLRVERTDTYTVIGRAQQAGASGVAVARNSSLAFAGGGVEGQHNVRVTGTGSGQATFILDAAAGQLFAVTEELHTDIDITASGRTQRFTQRVTRSASSAEPALRR